MAASTAAERGREVRQRLLAAAAELIPERGWRGVTTRNLAERAGVAPGLVHYHFASLQALLNEAAVGQLRGMLGELGPFLEGVRTPDELLELFLGALDRYSGRDLMSLLATEAYLASTRDEELRQAMSGVVAEVRCLFIPLLRQYGLPEPEATATVIAAAIDGIMLHRALDPTMTAAAVAPVLRRLLAPAGSGCGHAGNAGEKP